MKKIQSGLKSPGMDKGLMFELKTCRMCKGNNLERVIKLTPTPPANAFLTKEQLAQKEDFFPLEVNFCADCGQLQLSHVVSPKLLFENYVYVSSTSPVFVAHFQEYADDITSRFNLSESSLVIDIGSNDGILLKPLKAKGIKVLGVDPAKEIAQRASAEGIETIPQFLNTEVAKEIVAKHGATDVVTANNAFAHINDLDEIVESVKILTHKDGVFVIEFPYLVDFVEKNYFDLIYHEHVSYLSIRCLQALFSRFEMEIFDAKKVSSHGGSLRVYVQKVGGPHKITPEVSEFLAAETNLRLDKAQTFIDYAQNIETNKQKLSQILQDLKGQGKKIVGYGAPAKGNTLLIHFGIDDKILDYIVDDSPYKQGLYTPGTHIPVVPSSQIQQDKPDYILILAWNFADSIINKLSDFKNSGGSFIIPVPEPKVV